MIADKLEKSGISTATSTPEEFTALWMATAKQFGAVVRERHITVE